MSRTPRRVAARPVVLALLALLALLVGPPLAGVSRAAAQEADERLCGQCQTTGRIENPLRQSLAKDEEDVIFCSEAMRKDRVGFACEELVCPKCKGTSYHEAAKADIEGEIERRRVWLADREQVVDKLLRHPVVHIKTTHFNLSFDIPTVKIGQQVFKMHAAAHLYAKRLEELFGWIQEIHGLSNGRIHGTRRFLYLLESQKDASSVIQQVFGGSANIRYGDPSGIVDWVDKRAFREDVDYHQHVCHIAGHVIYNDVDQFNHWLVERYGWVNEGLAHYIEIRYFGPPNTWCFQETGAQIGLKGTDWEANTRKAVLANDAPRFEDVQAKSADALTPREHMFAWSWIDYLIWLDPKALPVMIGYMKGPQLPVRDCFQKAYGISVPAFVEGWKEFVRTQYSSAPYKGPRVRTPREVEPPKPEPETDPSEDPEDGRR